MDTDFI